jgi:hypothetical protein
VIGELYKATVKRHLRLAPPAENVAPDLVFPEPVVTHGRCFMWLRADIEAWMDRRPGR